MYNKKELLDALDSVICSAEFKLNNEETKHLKLLRNEIFKAKRETEILEWVMEIMKFITVTHEVFLHK